MLCILNPTYDIVLHFHLFHTIDLRPEPAGTQFSKDLPETHLVVAVEIFCEDLLPQEIVAQEVLAHEIVEVLAH